MNTDKLAIFLYVINFMNFDTDRFYNFFAQL